MAATDRTDAGQASTAALLSDAFRRVSELLRLEFDLARSEVAQNLNRAALAAGLLAGALVLALAALNVLAAAAVSALVATGLEGYWASLIVAGAFLLVALILAMKGVRDLRLSSIAPNRSARELRKDAAVLREVRDD